MKNGPLIPSKTIDPQALTGDLIQPGNPLHGIVWCNPERLSGEPCFYGTRVPIKNLFDAIESGESVGSFIEGFPGVTQDQVVAVLELALRAMLDPRNLAA